MNSSVTEAGEADAIDSPVLDRAVNLGAITWGTVALAAALAVGLALRFSGLDLWALAPEEARHSYDAWILYGGRPPLPGERLLDTTPLLLLLQALSFFLFGATDVTARLTPAVLGLAVVGLAYALRPFVGKAAGLGMAALAAVSPTLVYASRTATPEVGIACLSLLLLVAVLYAGRDETSEAAVRRWGAVAGFALGALLGSGPSAITVLLSLAVGMTVAAVSNDGGAVGRGLAALLRVPGAVMVAVVASIATVLVLFTRFFSDLGAVSGLPGTVVGWGRLVAESSVGTPTQFFLLALLLYEPLAILLGIVAAMQGRLNRADALGWPLFGGWLVAALIVWSFSTGRAPQHAIHVALPLVLFAGGVLGEMVAAIDWRDALRGAGGLLAVAFLGLLVGLVSSGILLTRVDSAIDERAAALQAAIVVMLVVVPLGYAAFVLIGREREAGRVRQPVLLLLLVLALVLGAFTLRSSILLNFYRADEGTELLAQRTATEAIRPAVDGLRRLSRDVTVTQGSVRDTTGGHGLSIAAERTVRWPFQWYFRDFPDFSVVDPGQAALSEAQVAIAPDEAGMAEAGYTARPYPWLNRVPSAYAAPDAGRILGTLFWPSRWLEGLRFLLYREGLERGAPESVAIGLNAELAARIFPSTGPFGLTDRPGAGSARGQFNQPIGVASAPDGTIYVVDQGNARVQRFDPDGSFIGLWGAEEGDVTFARTESGLGPTGLDVGPDGLVYVADTWNHRIVVLSPGGELIREIGGPPDASGGREASDTTDDPGAVDTQTGRFFGPRDVAVTNEEIYVVDTGNERVQVFGIDGTFKRVWGGYGREAGRLIEPVGIAIGPDGLIYVADSGNARISIFTDRGEPVAQWPVAAWPEPDPAGARPAFQPYLAFDANGALYATASESGSVEVLDRSGARMRSIREVGGDALGQPVGVAVTQDGDVLITDLERDAVYRYSPPAPPPVAVIEEGAASPTAAMPTAPGIAPTSDSLPDPPD